MKNNIDYKVTSFFKENKQDIQDNGFTKKVSLALPRQEPSKEWIVILFAIIGGIMTILLSWQNGVIYSFAKAIDQYAVYIVLSSFITPLVIALILLIIDKQKTSHYPFH